MSDIDKKGDRYIVAKLFLGAVGMFAFAMFLMPPFYNLLCSVLDINSPRLNTKAYVAEQVKIDTTRKVKVQFVTVNSASMPWEFHAGDTVLEVHPGESTRTTFHARNPTDHRMVAQAVPSIVPEQAVEHFHKTECFCFTQQTLEPGQEIDMPVVFIVDQALPADIRTITLGYTLFDVTDSAKTPAPAAKTDKKP
ncbi:MAG TPA: cytochrome c oxidase assembly protein [Pseudomonadales bacterium]|nr:cytochrome c oxidase assembly protein [Pseudomonadales bacterium]